MDAALQALIDRQAIVDTIVRWAYALELRRRAHEKLMTQHLSTNHLVTLHGDHATCVSATLIHRLDPGRQSDNTFDTLAHYTHTLVRAAAGWRIVDGYPSRWDGDPTRAAVELVGDLRPAGLPDA